MLFNSFAFLVYFLPISVIFYLISAKFGQKVNTIFLIIISVAFYCTNGWKASVVLLVSIVGTLYVSYRIKSYRFHAAAWMTAGIVFQVVLLGFFKYAGFFAGIANVPVNKSIVLPLGISFFTFQQIAWIIDTKNGKTDSFSISEYLLYILYFPKILMGPLIEPADFVSSIRNPKRLTPDAANISKGIQIFCFGMFKKMWVADKLANYVAQGYENTRLMTASDIVFLMILYSLQIYFDFSGYTDMASGVSCMLNIPLPINFDSPYRAVSIRDFWKRWHISLTSFLTKYLYIPLGGNQKGKFRTCLNVIIVFLISGFWHGANWTFILWGLLHGLLSVLDRMTVRQQSHIPKAIRWLVTMFLVDLLWLLFRSESVGQWWEMLTALFTLKGMGIGCSGSIYYATIQLLMGIPYGSFAVWKYIFGWLAVPVAGYGFCLTVNNNYRRKYFENVFSLIVSVSLFILCLVNLNGATNFIYNNF